MSTSFDGPLSIRILGYWMLCLTLTGIFFALLLALAPLILERDRLSSVWYYNRLAENKTRLADSLRHVATRNERRRLYLEAVEALEKAHRLRPDSRHYHWFWAQSSYRAAMLKEPRNPEEVERAVERIVEVWESTGRTWEKPAKQLADHYQHVSGELEKARDVRERMLMEDPEDEESYDSLAEIASQEGNVQQAIEVLVRKGKRLPLTHQDISLFANLKFRRGEFEEAARLLLKILPSGLNHSDGWLYALSMVAADRHERVTEILSSVLSSLDRETSLPPAQDLGLERYPVNLFPALAYHLLEAALKEKIAPK